MQRNDQMVFVSHSQDDGAAFSSVCLALEGSRLAFWDPSKMTRGASLREQLVEAVRSCFACVFIATRSSLVSQWCAAELGAFWGIGRRVVVLVADSSVADDDLPPQFRGDLWTKDMREVVASLKAAAAADASARTRAAQSLMADLEVEQFYAVCSVLSSRPHGSRTVSDAVLLLKHCVQRTPSMQIHSEEDAAQVAEPLLERLLGVSAVSIEKATGKFWPISFRRAGDGVIWQGWALDYDVYDNFRHVLILALREGICEGAMVAHGFPSTDAPIAAAGVNAVPVNDKD